MRTVPRRAPGRSCPKTARPRWTRPLWSCPGMGARFFYGWKVVGATFVMALFSFGLGFYGLTLYVATLQRLHGWSAATVSAPVTVYYLCGALLVAAVVLLAVLLALAAAVMKRGPEELGLGPDGDPCPSVPAAASPGGERRGRGAALRTWRFWSVSAPFALGLAAQVGVLTHLVSVVTPMLGAGGAARVVSATTAAAVIGRLVTGLVVDRLNRRLVSSATLVIQIAGLAFLAWAPSAMVLYAGCALFGMGVGNLTTLPGRILAVEWPREQ